MMVVMVISDDDGDDGDGQGLKLTFFSSIPLGYQGLKF